MATPLYAEDPPRGGEFALIVSTAIPPRGDSLGGFSMVSVAEEAECIGDVSRVVEAEAESESEAEAGARVDTATGEAGNWIGALLAAEVG